ncbi:MAG TPA: ribosome biogenesis GTPase Der [Chloroflexota bacterium]|nr:ribosome biogenesis GTPase Der [Chloroflexota bacterium]HZU06878.1 ribosome biogenesis GTPase Der [Chloroflexota bacterium]
MAKPLVALVGRPNVGKSTLFNRLIGEPYAVVHEAPGTTRDRLYGTVEWRGVEFTLVDTGGIGLEVEGDIMAGTLAQAQEAIAEADVIVFLVDAQTGLTPADADIARLLRRTQKPVLLAVNKAEGPRRALGAVEFHALGLGDPIPLSAIHGTGTAELLDAILAVLPPAAEEAPAAEEIGLAIVGRPNVGKSSLLNAIVGTPRSIVSAIPGTTRDAVDTVFEYRDQRLRLIDTAGIRRRGRITPGVERYSVLRALRAIDRADVVALVLDAQEGVTAQDAHVAGYIQQACRGVLLVLNKWDLVAKTPRIQAEYTTHVRRALQFLDYAPLLFVSAKTGQGVRQVLDTALAAAAEYAKRVPTARLNTVIAEAVRAHPLSERGRQLKVLYVTQASTRPPTFVFFVNDPSLLHFSYVRYLENQLRQHFGFEGTCIRLVFRSRHE